MKIICVGGGPAGLYLALLLKKSDPDHDVEVVERNQADDTFGWGVVFSNETLGNFEQADAETYAEICAAFRYWDNIDTHYQGQRLTSTGHGFCGLSRRDLLHILQRRCQALGVRLRFQTEIDAAAVDELRREADLVVACDGINSRIRERYAERFRPRIALGAARFTWLGTDLPLTAFTFIYRQSEHGLFTVHAYPFTRRTGAQGEPISTFIVECHESTWRRAGLDRASEEETIAYCERLFAPDLGGHRLSSNRSLWRTFPEVTCERWSDGNVVLLGDAAHSAHFSIGSGTKLAMEDAIALAAALKDHPSSVPAALSAYEERRRVDVLRLQRSARISQAWFENVALYQDQPPLEFVFNQLTRSLRITWDNLRRRDPALVEEVARGYQRAHAGQDSSTPAPPMFTPFTIRGLRLSNRVVVSPMCQYSAVDGLVDDWHLVHLGSRALGGAGLVMAEMTAVSREGRITTGCAGLYRPEHATAWRRIVDFVHQRSDARIGVQLGHAGRKGATTVPWETDREARSAAVVDRPLSTEEGAWALWAPSALPFAPGYQTPRVMDRAAMDAVREDHVRAARLAVEAGFDLLEIHMAHGYLLASFLSPLSNRRDDDHGGPVEQRLRFPLEILRAVRAVMPSSMPLSVRISASDWAEGGLSRDDLLVIARALRDHGADMIDVSSGGTVPDARPEGGRMYQVPFADLIRHQVGVPTLAVGNLFDGDSCNTILAAGRADLCLLARAHLRDPYFTLHEAERYGFADQPWPPQYLPARPRPRP